MNNISPQRYTRTFARLYADQGYYETSLEIYRHLLQKYPQQEDILDDFANIKIKMRRTKISNEPKLSHIFQQWMDLLAKYRQIHTVTQ